MLNSAAAAVSRRTLYILAACIAIFLIAAVLATPNTPSTIETSIFHWFNNWPPGLASSFNILTEVGSLPHSFILWIIAACLLGGRLAGLQMLLGGLGAAVAGRVGKEMIARGRPEDVLGQLHLYAGAADGYGFPSGHCTFAAVCATILFFYVKKPIYRIGLVLLTLLVGISRLYLGPHLPLDVIGGWSLGIACGLLIVLSWHLLLKQFQPKQQEFQE